MKRIFTTTPLLFPEIIFILLNAMEIILQIKLMEPEKTIFVV